MIRPSEGTPEYYGWLAARKWGTYIRTTEAQVIDEAQHMAPAPRKALDVGCGGGEWTEFLTNRGWSVTAVDVDPKSVRACEERNPDSVCALVGKDSRHLPAADESVSLVICIEVLAVSHSDWFLAEVKRVLVPHGRLVTVTWNRSSMRGLFADAAARIRSGTPHPHYQEPYRAWRRRLTDVGLEVEAERGLCWFPFSRASDSSLVPASAVLERRFGLSRLPALSPWVLVTGSRRPDGEDAVHNRLDVEAVDGP
ncbi:methyltransferase domain-containing protein [Geodermatophilus sp. YIM 151500]|uniref:class I SAM-dependent methyltransferase n=1 Tax=Geodermatophilus sp. YIM 151500 TaxID=2984531 RepID=UPI0021E4C8FE|nr:methyltransferase domain-containing protein [Geodermatophilus sp. YIM 151500]MCV2490660.1 methyltransferase domain-containing protein [Geodermatophilus sp. YIM 151500]